MAELWNSNYALGSPECDAKVNMHAVEGVKSYNDPCFLYGKPDLSNTAYVSLTTTTPRISMDPYCNAWTTTCRPSPSAQQVTFKTVRLKAGYVGQAILNGAILWESRPYKREHKALTAAKNHFADRLETLLEG